MVLKKISIINYKNIKAADLELSPKMNCMIGHNGMGKTNFLDAVYYLSFCRSAYNTADSQIISPARSSRISPVSWTWTTPFRPRPPAAATPKAAPSNSLTCSSGATTIPPAENNHPNTGKHPHRQRPLPLRLCGFYPCAGGKYEISPAFGEKFLTKAVRSSIIT